MTTTRLMSANLKGGKSPTGHAAGGPKLGLANAAVRMSMTIRRANEQRISLIGGQEVSGVEVRRVLERHGNWLPIVATPNDEFPSGATIGNVAFIDRRVWSLEEHLEIETWTNTAGELHFVDARIRHELTGRGLRVIVGHFPAGKRSAAQHDRMTCEADVRAAIRAHAGPTALLFDFNRPGAFAGWAGARNHVDGALVRGLPADRPRTHHGFKGTISDHAAVSIRVDLKRAP